MENYLREIFERKKEQISKYVLTVYDKSGELFSEMEKEVLGLRFLMQLEYSGSV